MTRLREGPAQLPAPTSPIAVAVRLAAEGLAQVATGDYLLASSSTEPYGRLFGRDSLITSLQFLSAIRLDPSLGPLLLPVIEGTLRALAALQGVMDDPWTEEEPGKIPHEYNVNGGGDFPGGYYASMDSTPLFLMALHEYAAVTRVLGLGDGETEGRDESGLPLPSGEGRGEGWRDPGDRLTYGEARRTCPDVSTTVQPALTRPSGGLSRGERRNDDGGLSQGKRGPGTSQFPYTPASTSRTVSGTNLLEELRDTRDRALNWILTRADLDGDGLVEFLQRNPERKSLINQNWRDSRDSLLGSDGSAPAYPVVYSEVQAYCYGALVGEATLRTLEDPSRAVDLLARANRLASAFERRFWLRGEGYYAQALDARKHPLADLTTNVFHWLWLGPIRPRRFRRAARRLLAADTRTPFGLRTLSSASPNYAPLRYHRGSIWPWDNWVAASALRRLGMGAEAAALDAAVLRALVLLGCPAELYMYPDGGAMPSMSFLDIWGRESRACRIQAWTVGYLVEMVARAGVGPLLVAEIERRRQDSPQDPTTTRAQRH